MSGKHIMGFALILVLLLTLPARHGQAQTGSNLSVSFLNVGQGDAILLHTEDDFDVLIDGGRREAGPIVTANLRQQHVDDIDVMVATHADSDHIGGLIDVLQMTDVPVRAVIYNGYPGTTQTWDDFATAVHQEGLSPSALNAPGAFRWGATLTGTVLSPDPGLVNPEQDEVSLALLIVHGNIKYLFTGDMTSTAETTVLARGTPLAAQVLKVAHHGSAYSSNAPFLSAVQAGDAIISVGPNSYGHPAPETLSRLQAAGARIWRTDRDGTIVVKDDGHTLTLSHTQYLFLPLVRR